MSAPLVPPPTNEELERWQVNVNSPVFPIVPCIADISRIIVEVRRLRELCSEAAGESFREGIGLLNWELWSRLRAAAKGK